MSKKLPKAIGRTLDDLRSSAAQARAETVRAAKEPAAKSPEASQPAAADEAAAAEPKAALPAERPNTLPVPVAAPEPLQHVEPDVAAYKVMLRRARAREVIERHAKYSAVGGLIPLPIVDVASVTAIVVRMARELARLYEVPEGLDRTRAIVLGLIGGTAPVGVGALSTSLLRFVPGANVVSMAVTSIAAAALTRSIGLIFLEHFESGRTLLDFKAERK
jgi:uncharacterized protein (DUF697 family)